MLRIMRPLWKSSLYNLFRTSDTQHAISELKRLEYILTSQAARFAVPFTFKGRRTFRSMKALQTPAEIEGLYQRVCELAPQRILEIGTAKGGTLYLWCQAATEDALIVSIDLPWGQFGGGYDIPRGDLYRAFAHDQQTMHLLRGNSHEEETFQQIEKLFDHQPVDFMFIDGDHTYEGVKSDLLRYGPLVRPGGMIAFHDIVQAVHDPTIEVDQLWDQIKTQFANDELVFDDNQGRRLGIGVIHIPETGFPAELTLK